MLPIRLVPSVHLFVCANRRPEGDPLGPGCGERGNVVYDVLKTGVARAGLVRSTWVTKTYCLGICPKVGTTVAAYPVQRLWTNVLTSDAPALLALLAEQASEKAAGGT